MQNLIAHPIPNGHSWTLATYAIKYIEEAEQLYGSRTQTYIYGGVEFIADGPPKVWYPLNKYVVVQLTSSAALDLKQGIFQLAHEIIHVLSPNGQATANNLEEGLATYFSKVATDRDTGDPAYALHCITLSKYLLPYTLVSQLITAVPDAIQRIRAVQPVLGLVTKQDFVQAGIVVNPGLVDDLVKPMVY
jgi:hypothetical protein